MFDSGVTLLEKIRCQSLLEVKGLVGMRVCLRTIASVIIVINFIIIIMPLLSLGLNERGMRKIIECFLFILSRI